MMGEEEVAMKTKSIKGKAPLVHRGIVIQRPAVKPTTSLARLRRAARIAVQQYVDEVSAAE
jgi:hypothetical protein